MRVSTVFLALLLTGICPALPGAELASESLITVPTAPERSGEFVGIWSGGALLLVENARSAMPIVHAYDKGGEEIQRVNVSIPEASLINVYSWSTSRHADGSFAVVGSAATYDRRGTSFLVWIAADGQKQKVMINRPYVPSAVTFAADGTIWTSGSELEDGRWVNPSHGMVRHFSRDGELLGSYLPRDSFPLGGQHPAAASQLVASGDRVGWFSKIAQVYVEFSLDGHEIGRYDTSVAEPHGVALCEDNSVWISSILRPNRKQPPLTELLSLDREAGKWKAHRRPAYSYIYGCDSALVTTPSPQRKQVERLSLK